MTQTKKYSILFVAAFFGIGFFGGASHASAAVAFQQVASSSITSTSVTFKNFAVTGTNPVTIICVNNNISSDDIVNVTFNGNDVTQMVKVQNPGGPWQYLYAFTGSSSITSDVVANFTNSSTHRMNIVQYTGAFQSPVYSGGGQTDAVSSATAASASSISNAITTITDNSWVNTCADDDNATGLNGSTNVTRRIVSSVVAPVLATGDTNAVVTPAGSVTQTWNGGSGANYSMLQITISPVATADASATPAGQFITFGEW